LASADKLVVSIDLHATAIKRFQQNLERISVAGDRIDPQVSASFRELVDSVVVMARKPGEPYRLETRGRLAALIGARGGVSDAVMASKSSMAKMSAKLMVPVEGT
jgi:hypothetical protein